MANTALAKAKAAINETRKAGLARYAKLRETETGRTMANEAVSTISSLAAGALMGAMPEQSYEVGGVSLPYAGLGGLALYVAGRQTNNGTVRAAGHGMLTGALTVMLYESAQSWA